MLAYCSTIGTAFNSQKWFTLDPCGIGCVVFSYFFHLYGLFNIHQTLISHSPIATFIFYALYCPCTLLALSNLFMAQHTDPGAIPLGARPLRVYEDEEDHKSESDSVASSLLDGIDVSNVTRVNRKKGVRRCRKCRNNYKPPRAHHDSVTGRCISKFDHFCPVS
jgi:palmitoyltransferase